MQNTTDTKPNGPVAAAVLAGGIGCLVLGVMVSAVEASADFGKTLDFSKNYGIGSGVGPLSGKAIVAVLAFLLSWGIAGYILRGKEVNFNKFFIAALVLIGLGFALTFPPIFEIFAPKA
jgi:hypothetical protein